MFVKRDSNGQVVALSQIEEDGFLEELSFSDKDIKAFLSHVSQEESNELEKTDAGMARVMEDLITLLVEQGTIRFTDLPEAAQKKMLSRRELRDMHRGVYLLNDDESLGI